MAATAQQLAHQATEEIRRCWRDLRWFGRYLKIFDPYTETLVPFSLNPAQELLHTHIATSRAVNVLKARRVGSSSYWLLRIYWRCLRRPYHSALVVVHSAKAARDLFRIVHTFNASCPRLLRPAPESGVTDREIRFPNGSLIRVSTANTEDMRSQTYGTILFSEFDYYEHPVATIAAALKTLVANGEVYLETTANGLGEAHRQWHRVPSAYDKVFLSWRIDPRARATKLIPGAVITGDLLDLAHTEKWSEQELLWAANTLERDNLGNFQMFCQETPSTPNQAFVTSGSRVFPRLAFPNAPMPPPEGWMMFKEPDHNIPVAMGVDVATGAQDGDYSAYTLQSATFDLYGTYYGRPNSVEFEQEVWTRVQMYNPLLAIELPGPGAALLDRIIDKGYFNQYRRPAPEDVLEPVLKDRMGWLTSETTRHRIIGQLHRNLAKLPLDREPRLQCEINTFEYDRRGRPGHSSKGHDDILFATGITMEATEQLVSVATAAAQTRPRTTAEICRWQIATGDVYNDGLTFDDDDPRPLFTGLSDY